MGSRSGVGAHCGSPIFFFCLFVLFVGVWEVEGKVKGNVGVVYTEGKGVMWNYTYFENSKHVDTKYLWLYVCPETGDYTCEPESSCETNVLDPQGQDGRSGVYWNNPQPGQLVQVFASEGTEDQLQETTYLKSSSDLGDDIQFLLGPGCQLPPSPSPPPSPPSPTPVRPSSKGWKWWKTLIVTVGFLLVMGLVVTFVYLLRRLDNSARESHELIN